MKRTFLMISVFMVVLICGCTLAPKYERPEAPVPAKWPAGPAYQDTQPAPPALAATDLAWQDFITDARLREIIETALANNRNLRMTALAVEKARAMYGISKANLLPSVGATGLWYKEHVPADLSTTGKSYTAEAYSVNLGMSSWEIDFFGRIRGMKDNALEEYLSTEQALLSARLVLISSVAQAYLSLAADRELLRLVSKTLEAQEMTSMLIKKRYDVGMASELDYRRSQTQVDTARGDVASYTQQVAEDENALNLLVGSVVPQTLLPQALNEVSVPRDFSAGLSSEPLLSRPDVLAAEHELKAANANIGVARATFFPKITLTTSVGTASAELSGLFKSGSGVWTFAPQISLPIFDARTWYAYDVAKVEKQITIAQYEKAIQTAFKEVSNALAEKGMIGKRVLAQQSLVDNLSSVYRLSEARYAKGIDSYLSVLDAQRSLYGAQQGLIALNLAKSNNLITLYKTIGGGQTANAHAAEEKKTSPEDPKAKGGGL